MKCTPDNDTKSCDVNVTLATDKPHVADAVLDKNVRIIVLYIEVILGAIGGALVCVWLWANRRRKSRVNKLIVHVAASDLLVIYCACLPQLVWEYDREWKAGPVFCKIIRFISSFAMMSSNYMLVILSIDRHMAIMYPLKETLAVWALTLFGWGAAAFFSIPQFFIFHQNFVTSKGPFENMTVCESIFRSKERWVRQFYLTYISIVVFYIPFIIIIICYVRIFVKISGKLSEVKNAPKKQTARPGKVLLQSSQTSSLSKAKIKILKMTVVIIALFAICGLPYHILEMIYSYGDHTKVPGYIASILGGMAVANSAVNPYVFLAFNASWNCVNAVCPLIRYPRSSPAGVYESGMSTHTDYVGASNTAMTDVHSRFNVNVADNNKGVNRSEQQKKNPSSDKLYINQSKGSARYERVESNEKEEY